MDPVKIAQALMPPTPTPLPPAPAAPILINAAQWRMWNFTDDAIMIWQQITPARTQVLQVAILLGIIVVFIFWVMGLIKSLTDEGNI